MLPATTHPRPCKRYEDGPTAICTIGCHSLHLCPDVSRPEAGLQPGQCLSSAQCSLGSVGMHVTLAAQRCLTLRLCIYTAKQQAHGGNSRNKSAGLVDVHELCTGRFPSLHCSVTTTDPLDPQHQRETATCRCCIHHHPFHF